MRSITIVCTCFLLSLYFFSASVYAQPGIQIKTNITNLDSTLHEMFKNLDYSKITTGILYDKAIMTFPGIEQYNGLNDRSTTTAQWKEIYYGMRRSLTDTSAFISLDSLESLAKNYENQGIVPLGVMYLDYNTINPDSMKKGNIYEKNGRLYEKGKNNYNKFQLFVIAPLTNIPIGKTIKFIFDKRFYFSNKKDIDSLKVNFGDGKGYTYLKSGRQTTVNISAVSQFSFSVQTTSGVQILTASSTEDNCPFIISYPAPDRSIIDRYGRAYIKYGCGNQGQLKKPILFVEGIDFGNRNDPYQSGDFGWPQFITGLDNSSCDFVIRSQFGKLPKLLNEFSAEGYDIILLDFKDGADLIQTNAKLLIDIASQVNAELKANGSAEQLIVIGASMGGLVSRYGLTYMEKHGLSHNTKLWMTIDSPHNGANIPLGTQHALSFLSPLSSDAASGIRKILRPAAQQMLVYHISGFDKNPLRRDLISDPNFNFPSTAGLQKVAISNGSQYSMNQGFNPGDLILDAKDFLTVKVWAMPNAGVTSPIFRATLLGFGSEVSASGNLPIDGAPGGFHPSTYSLSTGFKKVSTLQPDHCFIPTTSAIGFTGTDLFYNVSSIPQGDKSKTPFDRFYVPDNNQRHIEITDENIRWVVLGELGLPTLKDVLPVSPDVIVYKTNRFSPNHTPTILRAGDAGIDFDGITGYVSVPTLKTPSLQNIPFPDKGAITFWMNPSVIEDYRNPFSTTNSGNSGIRFEESTDNGNRGLAVIFGDDGGSYQIYTYADVNILKTNTWYHVILTWDKTLHKVVGYLNGQKTFSATTQIYWPTYFPNISIGTGFAAVPKRHFKGQMDDVGIYKQFISTDADILAATEGTLPSNVTIAYWDFSEGSGTTTADNSGTYSGTLQSGASWVNSQFTYTWTPSFGLNSTTGQIVEATPFYSTRYTVIATSADCYFTSNVLVTVFSRFGIRREADQDQTQDEPLIISDTNNISAYPNPASGNIIINVSGGSYKSAILDMRGRILNEYSSIEETMNIDISHLSTGLYLLQIIQNGVRTVKKLEIQQ